MYQDGGEASSRLKQGKGAAVPAKSFDSWEGTLAALGLTQSTPCSLPHEPEHCQALLEKVQCSDFTFLKAVLHTAIENPPCIRSAAVLNKEKMRA